MSDHRDSAVGSYCVQSRVQKPDGLPPSIKKQEFLVFLTHDQDEEALGSLCAGPGMRRWRSVLLEAPVSVVLVVWRSYEDEFFQYERAIVSNDAKLVELIADIGFSAIRHIYYLIPQDDGGLQFIDIVKLKVTQAASTRKLSIVLEDENGCTFGKTDAEPVQALTSMSWVLPKARKGSDVIARD